MKNRTFAIFATALFVAKLFLSGSPQLSTGIEIGDKAPLISSHLIDGTRFDSDSLKGKMVLVNFWASYDAPSRVDNFRKKMLLDQYQDSRFLNSNGFAIVSISLDPFKAPLVNAIYRDGLQEFYHLHDSLGQYSKIAADFGIENELYNILIDGTGRIVERNMDISNIEDALKRLGSIDESRFASREP